MDMAAKFQDQLVFHMTGRRAGEGLAPVDAEAMRPALFAGYRDLTRLRHDFPLVLVETGKADGFSASLSLLVNRVLETLAPRGIEGERLRKHVLRLEREIRAMLAAGRTGSLSELWEEAAAKLGSDADESVAKVLALAGCTLADVCKVGVWLDDARDFGSFNRVYMECFGTHRPARSTVESRMMIDVKVEMDVIAYKPAL